MSLSTDLPLALAQAAGTIKRRHWAFARYLDELGRVPVESLLGRVPGGDYRRPAAASLLLSVQADEDADLTGLAGVLLRIMAVLSPEGVHRDLLANLSPEAGHEAWDVDGPDPLWRTSCPSKRGNPTSDYNRFGPDVV